ncbi:MAG: hypothetical protein IKC79_01735 [Clostridia bacterium]|nr:hypothetical protein [Clostridia bacterium]
MDNACIDELMKLIRGKGEPKYTSLMDFLHSIVVVRGIDQFEISALGATNNRKQYVPFLKNCARAFVGDINGSKFTDETKIVRTIVLDYLYPNYIDEYLQPYIDKEIPSLKRKALWKYEVMMGMRPDNSTNMQHIGDKAMATEMYDATCKRLDKDWRMTFEGIKQINKIIKANVAESQADTSVSR